MKRHCLPQRQRQRQRQRRDGDALVTHLLSPCKPLSHVSPRQGIDEGDYAEAVGGSLPEYKEEKAFEQMLTGTEGETVDGTAAAAHGGPRRYWPGEGEKRQRPSSFLFFSPLRSLCVAKGNTTRDAAGPMAAYA